MGWSLKKKMTEMATSAEGQEAQDYKTVTGYPAQPSQEKAGCPPPHFNSNSYTPTAPPLPPNRTLRSQIVTITSIISVLLILVMYLAIYFSDGGPPCVPEFRVDSATVSPLNTTRFELTATWHLTLLSTNPDMQLTIYNEQIHASLHYGYDDLRIATTAFATFILYEGNQTRVGLKFEAVSQYVNEDVVKEISDGKGRGSVTFGVRVRAPFSFGSLMTPKLLEIYCYHVEFGFAPNNGTGTLTGQSRKCQVDIDYDGEVDD